MTDVPWVPCVEDLRVKLCYICREEERYDNPENPPRQWTHPCSCTLVAHESCLLQWIKSAQQDQSRAPKALKCPQCGATYQLESDNPRMLRVLNTLNSALSVLGKTATFCGVVGVATSFGFTLYVVSTSYGAFAVKEFLGQDMYNIFLTDDPGKWPWHAFIQLPIIPFSLILSRTRLFDAFPLVPLFLTWASSPPVHPNLRVWPRASQTLFSPPLNWPPTPLMAMVLLPAIRIGYRRFFDRLTKFVMGTSSDAPNGGAHADAPIRRVVWELNEDGPAPLRVRIGANIEGAVQDVPAARPGADARNAPQAMPDAPADNRNVNPNGDANANEVNDLPDDPAAVAERTLHVTTSSLGRFIGGALLVPTIANRMGSLLLHISRHSSLLRKFLAIREHPSGTAPAFPTPIRLFNTSPGSGGLLKQLGTGLVAGINIMCGGTPTWNAQDPVWWRNAVGLGLFVFAKDCVRLLHLWLTKRELESRKVKSRPFAQVDIRELDLITQPREVTPADASVSTTELQPAQ